MTLEPDAFRAAKAKAAQEKTSLGKAVSELILQALQQSPQTAHPSAVFRSEGGVYTSKEVEAALESLNFKT